MTVKDETGRACGKKNERTADYATILTSHRRGGGCALHLVVMREGSPSYPDLLEELQRDISEPQISLLIHLRNVLRRQ